MMRGYEVDEMVEAHCKEVSMDDSGLRAKVEEVFFHQSSIGEMTDKIIALIDAEYRPLLEELADYKAYYEAQKARSAMPRPPHPLYAIIDRIVARRSHDLPTDGT